MARFSAGGTALGVGSSSLPMFALCAASGSGGTLRQLEIYNTTSVSVALTVKRLSSAGTPGSALTTGKYNGNSAAAAMQVNGLYTSTGPTLVEQGIHFVLPAIPGAGLILTFGDTGLVVAAGVANGLGLVLDTGTGQVVTSTWHWDE